MTHGAGPTIPSGIITFLFTDVEGSTRRWAADVEMTARSFVIHDQIVRSTIEEHGGYVFGTAGDSFRGAFTDPGAAVAAAIETTQRLADAAWDGRPLLVRMGIHRGRATMRDGDYFGPVPNTAARIEAIAHGGQILMSDAVQGVVDLETTYLGDHRLRDVAEPMAIHQVGSHRHRPLRTIDPELSTLPNLGPPIIGRRTEVDEIRRLIEIGSLVTLTGTGGAGKTRLALEVAYQELPNRPDGCYFADLTSVSEPSELPAALAQAVRLQLTSDDPIEQIVSHLASREALLVLDNCEHIIDVCADFAERLLARSGSTILLATTRQRLEVDGEHVLVVPSLDHEGTDPAAVQLFTQRARQHVPDFAIDDDNREAVVEICRQLDGIPLSIELAAARVAVLPPPELLTRMEDRFRLLSGGRGRQKRRTLQATLDWSYDLLDPDEQTFFQHCGAFVGSFGRDAAGHVAGVDEYEAIDLLDSLLSKSLLVQEDGQASNDIRTHRFRMLETVRIYAGDQLARAGAISAARDRHLEFFRALTTTEDWSETGDLDRSLRLRPDWPNIAAALEWATIGGEWAMAGAMAFGCQGLWEHQVPATEGRRWLETILPELDNIDDTMTERIDWLRYHRAMLCLQLDDSGEVHAELGALATSGHPGPKAQALALHGFGRLRHDLEFSFELFDECDAVIRDHQLGPAARCPLQWGRGTAAQYDGRFEESRAHFEEAFAAGRAERHETTRVIIAGLSLAASQILDGDPEAAIVTLDSVDWSRSIWDSSPIVRALAQLELDRADDAAQLIIPFGHRALRGRLNRMSNDALVGLAALALRRGEPERAWSLLVQAVPPRSPATMGLAEGLADRLAMGAELRALHRERSTPLALLDASAAVNGELQRLQAAKIDVPVSPGTGIVPDSSDR